MMARMTPTHHRLAAGLMATAMTVACAAVAGVSAFERAPDAVGAAALAGLATMLAVGSHLLPVLVRGGWGWVIAAVCALSTIYGYAHELQQDVFWLATIAEAVGMVLWVLAVPRRQPDSRPVRVRHVVQHGITCAVVPTTVRRRLMLAHARPQPRDSPMAA